MTSDSPNPNLHELDLSGTILDFTPVPHARTRANGWSPLTQRRFIYALSVMGAVGAAARAVGMGRVSAYRLRARAIKIGSDAESFAAAWDNAISCGRIRQYSVAMEAALNGVTTVSIRRGGSVSVTGGPDMRVIRSALRETPVQRDAARVAP